MSKKRSLSVSEIIRVAFLSRRMTELLVPGITMSVFLCLAKRVELLNSVPGGYFVLSALCLAGWMTIQIFCLRRYCHKVYSPVRYLWTNGICWLTLTLLATVSAAVLPVSVNIWLFLPFMLLCFLGKSALVSVAAVSVGIGLVLFGYPIFVRGEEHSYYGRLAQYTRKSSHHHHHHRHRRRVDPKSIPRGHMVSMDELPENQTK